MSTTPVQPADASGPGRRDLSRRASEQQEAATGDRKPAPHTTGHRGSEWGFPAEGPGSVAGFGRRLAALLLDGTLSYLVATVIAQRASPGLWSSLVLFAEYGFFTAFFGQTPGMRVLGLVCIRLRDGKALGLWRAVLRALLLQLLIPAVIYDRNGRGLHDRVAGSVVLRVPRA
jgi:uncharacterized RDD family membrane protein YckC